MATKWKKAIVLLLAALLFAHAAFAAQLLEEGNTGETVMVLTRKLRDLGYIDAPTDEYGEAVASAVADFQTANDLERTGIADLVTQQAMHAEDAVTRQAYMTAFVKRYKGVRFEPGDRGDDIARVQSALAALGYYSGTADGVFGEGTRRAVAEYQRANGIGVTDAADESTLIRLFEGESISRDAFVQSQTAAKGDVGAHVRSIQERLFELGYFRGDRTGSFGEMTERAVSRFQSGNALARSGAVDADTYNALFSESAVPDESGGAIHPGDTGDEVFSLQRKLADLGFFPGTVNGAYLRDTETAVMLFRAANGLEISLDASREVIDLVYSPDARASDALAGSMDALTQEALTAIAASAREMVGESFAGDDGLFPGFGLMRHLFAQAGAQIGEPGEIISAISRQSFTAEDIHPGDILVLGRGDAQQMTLHFTIAIENGTVAYFDGESGTIRAGEISDLDFVSAYLWDFHR
ncbi:MAG: peptidoglycan-binding domain-containing protein [Christensenellales bacterium]